jgi:hypothetical protein
MRGRSWLSLAVRERLAIREDDDDGTIYALRFTNTPIASKGIVFCWGGTSAFADGNFWSLITGSFWYGDPCVRGKSEPLQNGVNRL